MRNLEVTDVYATDYSDGFTSASLSPQTHQLYTLNMYSFLCVNYNSIEWLRGKKAGEE